MAIGYGLRNPTRPSVQVNCISEEECKRLENIFNEGYQWINSYYGAILDTADSALVDAVSILRKKGKYKREIKFRVGRAAELSSRTAKVLRTGLQQGLYLDMLDKFQDIMQPEVKKLYEQVTQALHKAGVEHARWQANFEVVTILLGVSKIVYNMIIDEVNNVAGRELSRLYPDNIKPDHIMKRWNEALPLLVEYTDEVSCQVLKNPKVARLATKLKDMVTDKKYVDVVMCLVGYEHPDVLERYAEEVEGVDINELREYAKKQYEKYSRQ